MESEWAKDKKNVYFMVHWLRFSPTSLSTLFSHSIFFFFLLLLYPIIQRSGVLSIFSRKTLFSLPFTSIFPLLIGAILIRSNSFFFSPTLTANSQCRLHCSHNWLSVLKFCVWWFVSVASFLHLLHLNICFLCCFVLFLFSLSSALILLSSHNLSD